MYSNHCRARQDKRITTIPLVTARHLLFAPIGIMEAFYLYHSRSETVIFVANAQTMTVGVYLHKTRHIAIFLDRHWNMTVMGQAFD